MAAFSETSKARLATCHPDLQLVMNEVIKHFDCTILCGERGQVEQEEAFKKGNSTKHWPDSKHNRRPQDTLGVRAVDAAPYPLNWSDMDRFRYFAGFVMGVAAQKGIKLRSGLDWDGDTDLKDQNLIDAPHFELTTP